MRVLEQVEAFFGRKRPLRYIVIALLLAGLGHLLESKTALGWVAAGQALTRTIDTQLHRVQPFAIADTYRAETAGRRGLWFCATDDELAQARNVAFGDAVRRGQLGDVGRMTEDRLPPGKTECSSWLAIGRGAITSVMATPAVGVTVWREGGWVNRLLLPLTVLGIAAILVAMWRGTADGDSGPVIQSVALLAFGPLVMGAVFWLSLWVLLALIWAFGNVLAGLGWVIATFAGVYKVCAFCIGILKSSDGIADQHVALATPAAPPPKP